MKFSKLIVSLLVILLSFNKAFSQQASVQDYYSLLKLAYEEKDFVALFNYCEIVVSEFPNTPFSDEARYFQALGYYNVKDLSNANEGFTNYLKLSEAPKHFEEALSYKFKIAEKYRNGALRRMFHFKKAPKIAPAKEDAIEIYDEIISSLPHHDLSARSLYGKGLLQIKFEDFREAIETFQILVKRFSKHECSIEAFVEIAKTYLKECQLKNLNPELIALAELNLKRFNDQFPSEQKIKEVDAILLKIKELFAQNLFNTGKFFERRKKIDAAIIYYKKIISSFPKTETAQICRKRLQKLQ
jgi:outer membrane protein assembly factor BamD (BamD/ComL family)